MDTDRFDRAINALTALRDGIYFPSKDSAHGLRDRDRIQDKITAMETVRSYLTSGEYGLEDLKYRVMVLLSADGLTSGLRQGYDLALSYISDELEMGPIWT